MIPTILSFRWFGHPLVALSREAYTKEFLALAGDDTIASGDLATG